MRQEAARLGVVPVVIQIVLRSALLAEAVEVCRVADIAVVEVGQTTLLSNFVELYNSGEPCSLDDFVINLAYSDESGWMARLSQNQSIAAGGYWVHMTSGSQPGTQGQNQH